VLEYTISISGVINIIHVRRNCSLRIVMIENKEELICRKRKKDLKEVNK
jgi:hypothetical protein